MMQLSVMIHKCLVLFFTGSILRVWLVFCRKKNSREKKLCKSIIHRKKAYNSRYMYKQLSLALPPSLEDNIVDSSEINFQRDPPRETDGVSREQANSNRHPNAEREYRGI